MKTLPISKTEYTFRNIKEIIKVKKMRPKLAGYEFDEAFIRTERDRLYQERVTELLTILGNPGNTPQTQAELKQRLEQNFETFFENYIEQNSQVFYKHDETGKPIPVYEGEEETEVEKEVFTDGVIDVSESDLRQIGKTKKFEKDFSGAWQIVNMTAAELIQIKQKEQEQLRENYPQIVESLIRQRFTISQEIAILRQRDIKPEEFAAYNVYAEECKTRAKSQTENLII